MEDILKSMEGPQRTCDFLAHGYDLFPPALSEYGIIMRSEVSGGNVARSRWSAGG